MSTYRSLLRELAFEQHGFVTTADAAAHGVPAVELRKLAQRGALERVGLGVYRMTEIPYGDLDRYAEAVHLVGPHAHLTHDAVLALHGLALVNPIRIRVGTDRRVRTNLPSSIELVREYVPDEDLTTYEGIPSTTVARALIDSTRLVMTSRLLEATDRAAVEGLITTGQRRTVKKHLTRTQHDERRP